MVRYLERTALRAIVKAAPGPGAELRDVPEPAAPTSDLVLVKVLASSICGTDYHIYSWDAWSAARVQPPRIMGHEFAGEIVAVGPEVKRAQIGDYVSGESHWVCGVCDQCRAGQMHVCRNTRILGVDVDGCFADYVLVPEMSTFPNDGVLPPEIACIQDPLGNAVHATLAGEVVGRSVVVLGCGPIGIFAVAVAKAAGASYVWATDTRDYRLELATALGADGVVNAAKEDVVAYCGRKTHGKGVDVALEMSGAPSAIRQAMRITRPGGRVSLMGIPANPVELDISEMIFKGLDVKCIVGRRIAQTWQTMHTLLASGRLDVRPAVTHQMPFEDFEHGMRLMQDGLCGKVVFRMS